MVNVVLTPQQKIRVKLKPQQGIKIESSNKYLFDPSVIEEYVDLSQDWAVKTDGLVEEIDYSSKAYAIGGTGTETNNSKYYSQQAATSATNASTSETNAGISATTASTQAGIATNKANDASASATTATTQAGIAIAKAGEASTSATNAGISETNAGNSATAASNSANSASASASLAHDWATSNSIVESGQYGARYYSTQAYNANVTAQAAKDLAKDWANKTDGTVDGSEYSAKYYAGHSKVWAEGSDVEVQALGGIHSAKGWADTIGSVYKPAGSVAFASLPTLDSDHLGFVYNVTDAFTTTSDFVEGAGKDYPAGTNVVCIDTGSSVYKWDILGSFVDLSGYQPLLVSGTNIKTINSNSILGSGNLDINGLPTQTGQSGKFLTTDGTDASWANVDALPSQTGQSGKYLTTDGSSASWATVSTTPSIDNKSITTNGSSQLQTIGVIDQNNTSTAIKTWTGTKAQYDAILSKDANTLYNITDDTDVSLSILEALYPVGSIYITTANNCPLSALISGSTWTLVGQDRVLQGAGTRGTVGTTLNESLPNITGYAISSSQLTSDLIPYDSSGTLIGYPSSSPSGAQSTIRGGVFSASNSLSTYQDNAPVQPDAYLVNIFRRIS